MLKPSYLSAVWLLLVYVLMGCNGSDEKKGMLYLSFSPPADGKAPPSNVLFTIVDESQNEVYRKKGIRISKSGNGYVTDSIFLDPGNYQITEFLVLTAGGEVIQLSPERGGAYQGLVTNFLPVNFDISLEKAARLELEVGSVSFFQPDMNLGEGLIGLYELDGHAENSEGRGPAGVLGDASGQYAPMPVADRFGVPDAAMAFDGTKQYVNLTENPVLNLGYYDTYTISLWIDPEQPSRADDRGGVIFGKHISAGENRMYNLRILDGNLDFRLHDNGTQDNQLISTPISFQTGWHHVAVVAKNEKVSMYLDGGLVGSFYQVVEVLYDSPTVKTVLGAAHFSQSLFDVNYTGKIDDFRIYDRALSRSEVFFLARN